MTTDLGLARGIDAQSFGQPGQRTFRLRVVGSGGEFASLWMEKQQLQVLNLALAQILAQVRYEGAPTPAAINEFPEAARHEFRVGRMAVGFDSSGRSIVICAFDTEAGDEDEPVLCLRVGLGTGADVRQQLGEIIAAGRPVCPLCHMPVDASSHQCVRTNGHSRQPPPAEDLADEDE